MPTRQDKSDARAKRHLISVQAHDTSLPHTKQATAQPEFGKSIIAKHKEAQEKILDKKNFLYMNVNENAVCNQHDCFSKGEYIIQEEEHAIIIVF